MLSATPVVAGSQINVSLNPSPNTAVTFKPPIVAPVVEKASIAESYVVMAVELVVHVPATTTGLGQSPVGATSVKVTVDARKLAARQNVPSATAR